MVSNTYKREPVPSRGHPVRGFTLIEALVTMSVLSVAFLGMVALLMSAKTSRSGQQHLNAAAKLTQAKVSQLSHVDFALLATGTTGDEKELYGAPDEEVVVSGLLNKKGETDDGSTEPPFLFTRSFVVCMDNDDGGADAPSDGGAACGDVTSSRPDELACDTGDTESKQAIVKVLTTYRDRHGKCHKNSLTQMLVDFN